jgi:hypothetical protein
VSDQQPGPGPDRSGHPQLNEVAPTTDVPEVDQALQDLADLAELPVTEHHDRLAAAHAALENALHRDPSS